MEHDSRHRRSSFSRRGLFIFMGISLMSPVDVSAASTAANGVWGTTDAVLTIGARQSRIEWGNAEAAINAPITPDANGRFKTTGHYHTYTPGPDREGASPAARDARIEGRIVGDSMEMTLHISGERAARRYVFKKGKQAKLHRML
jgi:hypothetical protein